MMFKAVDADSATKAKDVLSPFRWDPSQSPIVFGLNGGIMVSQERADRLQQAIAEAIHVAANRPVLGDTCISAEEC